MHDLILLRHAEAEPVLPGHDDRDRPLSNHGEDEARAAGRWLAQQGARPDRVLCSPVARTRRTAELALAELGGGELSDEAGIYDATAGELLALLDGNATLGQVLLVGHNPGVERLLALLVSGQSGSFRGVPPAAAAWIRLDGPLEPGAGQLIAFHSP
ncbi:MAG TPA: histidine phosphatase family protein [Rhodanobacteraceae bacterium]|nr:histidine phosphatase family protein [Rhodanobacteraceae bacterium]